MSTPRISVIIPVYNTENYLKECLDSIINQTFKDLEIICVNDGSTDNSAKILEEYALQDSRIIVLHQTNQKLAAARNTGLEAARGQYISFIDSDDFLDLQTYEMLSQKLDTADLIAFAGESFLTGYNENLLKYYKGAYDAPFTEKKNLTDGIRVSLPVSVCMKLFKKSIIDQYNLRFPRGLRYEDNAFTFSYLAVSKNMYYFDQPFYQRRLHDDSIMGSTFAKQKSAIDILYVCKDIYQFLMKYDLFEKNEQLFAQKLKSSLFFALNYSPASEKNAIYQEYESCAKSFFGNSDFASLCLHELKVAKKKYTFSPRKYYTYKILSLLTFGKAKERFCRKYSYQKGLRD